MPAERFCRGADWVHVVVVVAWK